MKPLIIIIAAIFLLTGCFKEDEKIPPHEPGSLQLQTVGMGQYYETQIYFDLSTNQIVTSHSKDLYDLKFACADSALLIKLNSAMFMKAASTGDTNFFGTTDTTGVSWKYDASSGNNDSIAIDNWFDITVSDTIFNQKVFIIDRGITALGVAQGVRKFRVLAYQKGIFTIQYANMDNSKISIVQVVKNPEKNFVQLNLNNNEPPLDLEPKKADWDLLFCQYTDILRTDAGEDYPYLVTGVLVNQNGVQSGINHDLSFDNITMADLPAFDLTTQENNIGYEWKWYDFNAGYYSVLSDINYAVKDTEGYYYKLRFVGFYNSQGLKGFPQFEFQKL
ncbi:MAG: HmuY family protein [Bacteroidales bacterium]|nr:HmuY family protein [Bacteroidales bacterium]